MFYYFGRKGRLAGHYPAPEHDLVLEPFAGSMAYSLHHRPVFSIGVENNLDVCREWWRVTRLSKQEIRDYPEPVIGSRVSDRWAMFAGGSHGTSKALSYIWTERMSRDFSKQKRLAEVHVDWAKNHVCYRHGHYSTESDHVATWFIDPPYQKVSRGYLRDGIDYQDLADWVRSRVGLVIVCEQEGADWLPFVPLRKIKGTNNKMSQEVVFIHRTGE